MKSSIETPTIKHRKSTFNFTTSSLNIILHRD
jgi:hypothetical protein